MAEQANREEERAQRDTAQPADLMTTPGRSDYAPTTLATQPADPTTHHSHPVLPAPGGCVSACGPAGCESGPAGCESGHSSPLYTVVGPVSRVCCESHGVGESACLTVTVRCRGPGWCVYLLWAPSMGTCLFTAV